MIQPAEMRTLRPLAITVAMLSSLGWLLDSPLGTSRPVTYWMLAVALGLAICGTYRVRLTRGQGWPLYVSSFVFVNFVVTCLLFGQHNAWLVIAPAALMAIGALIWFWRFRVSDRYSGWLLVALSAVGSGVVIQAFHEGLQVFLADSLWLDRISQILLSPFTTLWLGPDYLQVFDGRSIEGYHVTYESSHIVWGLRFIAIWAVFGQALGILSLRYMSLGGTIALGGVLSWGLASFGVFYVAREPLLLLNRGLAAFFELFGVCLLVGILPEVVWRFQIQEQASGKNDAPSLLRSWSVQWIGVGSVALITLFWCWYPVGPRRSVGELIIDDAHSTWEVSNAPFDLTDPAFTKLSGYSYSSFAKTLAKLYKVRINTKAIADESLKDASVLILKTPTTPFEDSEVETIRRFVARGGGLFVHGDHTNLYGMSAVLNDLLEPMGVEFNYDDQAGFDGQPSSVVLESKLGRHPTVNGIGNLQFLTSCTLQLRNILAEPVIVDNKIFSEKLNYGRPGFFGNMLFDPRDRYGRMVQAAVVPYGQGRVAVFADSTLFSNFTLYSGAQVDYALKTLDYLHGRPTVGRQFVGLLGVIGLGLCLGLHLIARRRPYGFVHLVGPVTSFGIGLGLVSTAILNAREEQPSIRHQGSSIDVCIGDGSIVNALKDTESNEVLRLRDFGSFLTVIQRIGGRPRVVDSLDHSVEAQRLVWINPNKELGHESIHRLAEDIAIRGKRMLLVMDEANSNHSALELLGLLGMPPVAMTMPWESSQAIPAPAWEEEMEPGLPFLLDRYADMKLRSQFALAKLPKSLPFLGTRRIFQGETVLWNQQGMPLLTKRDFPSGGSMVVCYESATLSGYHLGGGFMKSLEPSEINAQRGVAEILVQLGFQNRAQAPKQQGE